MTPILIALAILLVTILVYIRSTREPESSDKPEKYATGGIVKNPPIHLELEHYNSLPVATIDNGGSIVVITEPDEFVAPMSSAKARFEEMWALNGKPIDTVVADPEVDERVGPS